MPVLVRAVLKRTDAVLNRANSDIVRFSVKGSRGKRGKSG